MKVNVGYYLPFCIMNKIYDYASSALIGSVSGHSATTKLSVVVIIRLVSIMGEIRNALECLLIETWLN
jgi:hypothetical protein